MTHQSDVLAIHRRLGTKETVVKKVIVWFIALQLYSGIACAKTGKEQLEQRIPKMIAQYKVAGVGMAIIEGNQLKWSGYFGKQALDVPVNDKTMFNVASVAKTVTAETVLRLVDQGFIDLDEPIAKYWQEPDLLDDPQYLLLTPRIILSHSSGLLNWRYAYPDNKLAFVSTPGEKLTYSGAAFEMLIHFVEAKLGQGFEALAAKYLYNPLGLKYISLSRQDWIDKHVTHSMDKSGKFHKPYTYPFTRWVKPVGYLDGADDFYVSVEDYARLLMGVMHKPSLSPVLNKQRLSVITNAQTEPGWACTLEPPSLCPSTYGYGLGWTLFGYDDRTFIQHGGQDFGEFAMVYYIPETGQGVVIFVNGGNGAELAYDVLELLERGHPLSQHFRAQLRTYQQQKAVSN